MQVKDGISICATIHCPPAQTFQRFDRIFLLQRGRVVFFGQNNAAAAGYFQEGFPEVCISRSSYIVSVKSAMLHNP